MEVSRLDLSNKYLRWGIFTFLFVAMSIIYYDSVLQHGPLGAHIWRQADCLSMTRNYMEGANFLEPEMDILLADDLSSGKSAGEFPLLYYITGKVWSWFGVSHMFFRVFYLLILYAGILSVFATLELVFKNFFISLMLSLLLFTSPVLAFYGISFLTDAPAFCFSLVGIYFLTRYHFTPKTWLLVVASTFFALSGLLKISMLIGFIFLAGILVLEAVTKVKTLGSKHFYQINWKEFLAFGLVIVSIFSWYYYASLYNAEHGFKYTFNDVHPFWAASEADLELFPEFVRNFTINVFFSRPVLFVLFFIGILNLFLYKRIPLFAYLANAVIILGTSCFFMLWLPLFGPHDYYFIALLILYPGILGPFLWYLFNTIENFAENKIFKTFVVIFFAFNVGYCTSVVKLHTFVTDGDHYLIGNHSFVSYMRWTNSDVFSEYYRWQDMRSYLGEIGVEDDAKLICFPDYSFNVTLYLVGHKGWTNFKGYTKTEEIQELVDHGADYLLIGSDDFRNADFLKPFTAHLIGESGEIYVYDLTNLQPE